MANPNSSGPEKPEPDEDRNGWRPADDEPRPDRDEPAPKQQSTDRDGQGQSGYGAGRRGADPAQRYQNRNPRGGSEHDEDRRSESGMGLDDRFEKTDRRDRVERSDRADGAPREGGDAKHVPETPLPPPADKDRG